MPSGPLKSSSNVRYSDVKLNFDREENRLENILEETLVELGSSESVPLEGYGDLRTYNNDEDLRMSEERLLAKLQNEDDEDLTEVVMSSSLPRHPVKSSPLSSNGQQRTNGGGGSDSEVGTQKGISVGKSGTASPRPKPPSLAHLNSNGNTSFSRHLNNSIGSNLWTSHDHHSEDKYHDHECDDVCGSELHKAAKTGCIDLMEYRLEVGDNPNARDCMGRTPLHWAVCTRCNCDTCTANAAKCTQLLVDHAKTDINVQDSQGETALHLAAENQSTKCASILLYSAADVSIKSKAGVKALTLMVEKIPEAMDSLLNRAVTVEKYDCNNCQCQLRLDFGAIVGYTDRGGNSQRNGKGGADGNIKAKKEMQLLTLILDCSSSARKKILMHPLIGIFLHLKWTKIKIIFWATILLHVLLLLLYTTYILDVYLISCPYRPKITEPAAVKAAKAEGNYLQSEGENSTYRAEFIKFSWFEFSPQLQELGTIKSSLYDGCPLEIGPTVKSVLLLALTILMVVNECFKMLPAPRAYWKRTNNRMQWTLFFFIFITSWPVFMSHPNINFWQYQAAAFGLFLAWALMLTQIGKFPILGLYVEILTKVLKNFGFFMVTYASLLMAFALAFCVLFPGNAPYSSIPLAILKVLMMMVGEVNYEDLFYGNEENPVDDLLYPITGHILYGAFVIMITIVLMNLLVGLTVSDIQGLQKDAELTRLSRQIGEIAQLESFVFSKRVQSFLPGRFAAFLRDSILVVPPSQESYGDSSLGTRSPINKGLGREESWYFHCRPNDPNDKSIPEDLKASIIRLAASRHRTKRTNKCSKILNRIGITPLSSPLKQDYQWKYGNFGSTSAFSQAPSDWSKYTSRQTSRFDGDPGTEPYSSLPFTKSVPSVNDRTEVNYLMRRLEEKLMDRMKMQMDSLYQKIEERMMDQ